MAGFKRNFILSSESGSWGRTMSKLMRLIGLSWDKKTLLKKDFALLYFMPNLGGFGYWSSFL
jgi:hypothetical protein